MAVQQNALVPRKADGFHEGFFVAVDGLAGRDNDLAHRKWAGVVVGVDGPFAIGDEFVGGLQHFIGDSAAFGFGQGVAAAPGDKAHAHQFGGLKLAVDDAATCVTREAVLVIEGCCAAVFYEFCHRHNGRMVEAIFGQAGEDRVDQIEPFDDGIAGPVEIGAVAHEALEEMVVRVHEAGVDEHARSVDELSAGGELMREVRADGLDGVAVDQQVLVPAHGIMGRGHNSGAVFEQDCGHAGTSGAGWSSCSRWMPGISMKPGRARMARIQRRMAG